MKLSLQVLSSLSLFLSLALSQPFSRIINGVNEHIDHFPFVVSIQHDNRHFCGGSFLSKRFILTAAHCLQGYLYEMSVKIATTDISKGYQVFAIEKFIRHENYNSKSYENDIGLIQLRFSIMQTEYGKISTTKNYEDETSAIVLGWGWQSETSIESQFNPILQRADVKIISNSLCQSMLDETSAKVLPSNVCTFVAATDQSPCHGDSVSRILLSVNLTSTFS